MSHIKIGELKNGYNPLVSSESTEPAMLMDIGVQKMDKGTELTMQVLEKEVAYLLLDGEVEFQLEDEVHHGKRNSVFDERATLLHVPSNTKVTIRALSDVELLLQMTENATYFAPRFYKPSDIGEEIFCDGLWGGTAKRIVRKIFDYTDAPASNMVIGETINFPGRWSSYVPHSHDQPEVYYYRFNHPNGFGATIIDDAAYKVEQNSAICIPGGAIHPQASAPGYAMYFCWMIRHLPDNPWTTRNDDPRYLWLLEEDVKIWPDI
jgi:5-deoxy-glucuronate isomerase